MLKKTILFLAIVFSLASVPSAFSAEPTTFFGKLYFLKGDESVEGDLFVCADEIRISGAVTGNVFLMGSDIWINGNVGRNLYVIGSDVEIKGDINGDTEILAGTAKLYGTFEGEVALIGSSAILNGNFKKPIAVKTDTIKAKGNFGDSATLRAKNLTIASGAIFAKDLTSIAATSTIAEDAIIMGKLTEITGKEAIEKSAEGRCCAWWFWAIVGGIFMIGMIVIGFVFHRLFPIFIEKASDRVFGHFLPNLGRGVLGILAIPIGIVILFITIIGIPLGLITLLLFCLGLYFGKLFVAIAAGALLLKAILPKKKATPFWASLIVGTVLVYLVSLIPYLGWIAALFIAILGLGALLGETISLLSLGEAKPKKKTAQRAQTKRA